VLMLKDFWLVHKTVCDSVSLGSSSQ